MLTGKWLSTVPFGKPLQSLDPEWHRRRRNFVAHRHALPCTAVGWPKPSTTSSETQTARANSLRARQALPTLDHATGGLGRHSFAPGVRHRYSSIDGTLQDADRLPHLRTIRVDLFHADVSSVQRGKDDMRVTCMIVDEQCQFSLAGRCGLQLREPPHVRELLAHIGECLAASRAGRTRRRPERDRLLSCGGGEAIRVLQRAVDRGGSVAHAGREENDARGRPWHYVESWKRLTRPERIGACGLSFCFAGGGWLCSPSNRCARQCVPMRPRIPLDVAVPFESRRLRRLSEGTVLESLAGEHRRPSRRDACR